MANGRPASYSPDEYWQRPGSAPRDVGLDVAATVPAPLLQYPVSPPQCAPRRQRRRGRAWIAAGAGVAATAVAVAVVVGLTGNHTDAATASKAQAQAPAAAPTTAEAPSSPSTEPPLESPVEDGDLVGLLPTPHEVARIMRVERLASIDKMNGPGMFSDLADPAECIGVVIPDARAAYAGSGMHVNYVQAWSDPDSRALSAIQTGVTTFDSSSDAQAFVDQQSTTWATCSLKPVVVNPDNEHRETWDASDVATQGGTLVAHLSVRHVPGRCERALSARRNVVIDVITCSQNPDGTATALTSAVTKRLGRAT
jgi:hypothetical protein